MDPTIPANYYQYAMMRESGGDPSAQNPLSSAGGLFQFTTPTWDGLAEKYPSLGLTPGGQKNPKQAWAAMQAFTQDNANTLASNGVPINNDTLYLAHRFGSEGALKALHADPDAPVSSVFDDAVMKENPDLRGKTIADITGATTMPSSAPALYAAAQQQPPQAQQPQGPGLLYGGNPTPIGMVGGLARMLGIGSEDDLGRRMQNAGNALIAVGLPSSMGSAGGAAAMDEAANMPHFNVVTDALGNRILFDTRTGAPMSMNGQGVGGQGGSGGWPATANGASRPTTLNQSPVAMAAQAKADADLSAKKMSSLDDAAAQAQSLIDMNRLALEYSKDPNTVQGPGIMNMIRDKLSELTNGSLGGVDISKQDELEKLNSGLVGKLLQAQKGVRFAAPEIKFGQTASADVDKPPLTNQQIYETNIQNLKRVVATRDIARQAYSNGLSLNGPEFSQALQKWQDANPVYQPTVIKGGTSSPSGGGPTLPKVGEAQQGYVFKGGNPADPNSWEKQ